jgi:hypothetical protein
MQTVCVCLLGTDNARERLIDMMTMIEKRVSERDSERERESESERESEREKGLQTDLTKRMKRNRLR